MTSQTLATTQERRRYGHGYRHHGRHRCGKELGRGDPGRAGRRGHRCGTRRRIRSICPTRPPGGKSWKPLARRCWPRTVPSTAANSGPRVFADPAALQTLNHIMHGKIFAYIQGQIAYIRRTESARPQQASASVDNEPARAQRVVAVEAAVLLEAGCKSWWTRLWVVVAPVEVAIARLRDDRGVAEAQAAPASPPRCPTTSASPTRHRHPQRRQSRRPARHHHHGMAALERFAIVKILIALAGPIGFMKIVPQAVTPAKSLPRTPYQVRGRLFAGVKPGMTDWKH